MPPPKQWERFERPDGPAPHPAAGGAHAQKPAQAPPGPAAAPAAKFVIRRAPPPASTPWQVWVVLAGVLLVFGWKMVHRPDAEYLRAQRLVADFERGKAPESINYQDPVYDEALEHLHAVTFVSGSARAAARMATEILDKRQAFAHRLKAAQARMDAARVDREARAQSLLDAQRTRTGTDTEAAARLTANAPKECQEERRRPARPRTD